VDKLLPWNIRNHGTNEWLLIEKIIRSHIFRGLFNELGKESCLWFNQNSVQILCLYIPTLVLAHELLMFSFLPFVVL